MVPLTSVISPGSPLKVTPYHSCYGHFHTVVTFYDYLFIVSHLLLGSPLCEHLIVFITVVSSLQSSSHWSRSPLHCDHCGLLWSSDTYLIISGDQFGSSDVCIHNWRVGGFTCTFHVSITHHDLLLSQTLY